MQHVRKKKKKKIACREAVVRSLLPISSWLSDETGKIAGGARKSGAKTGKVRRQPRSSMRGTGVALKVIMIMTNVPVSGKVVFLHPFTSFFT